MKRAALFILFLCGLAISAFGQESLAESLAEDSFKDTFSVEVGTGIQPIHTYQYYGNYMSRGFRDEDLRDQGQIPRNQRPFNLTLSQIWAYSPKWELKLTEDFSWYLCDIYQYPTFGVDPDGHPRYERDYSKAEFVGRRNLHYSFSATILFRRIWSNPQNAFQTYSEFGLGYVAGVKNSFGLPVFFPGITLIGVRYRWEHFYLYAENTYSPAATLVHGGLGWKF